MFGQDSLKGRWLISIDFGIQEHDKRLFGFPPKKSYLSYHPETFGTYQLGINLRKELIGKKKLKLSGGLGLSSELSTFLRPFDHKYGEEIGNDQLLSTDRYFQFLLQSPVNISYIFSKRFRYSVEILPQMDFLTYADHSSGPNSKNGSWSRWDLYSIEINSGIDYTLSNFIFSIKYRVFQFKKIDKIIFNDIINDPRIDQVFETANPFKVWFSVGFVL